MIKKIFFTFILCLLSFAFFAENNDVSKRLQGTLVAAYNSVPISNAHIINKTRAMGNISDYDGSFSINVHIGDTVIFQALGFVNYELIISEMVFGNPEGIEILLESKIYELSEVEIYPFGTYAQFKDAFINFDHSEQDIDLNLPASGLIPAVSAGGGIVIQGPITFFYEKFSRKHKNLRRYYQHTYQDELAYRASLIINHDIVKQLTPLEDENDIDIFLSYCNMSREYIVNTSKYIVYQTLLTCYNEYKTIETK